MNGFVHNVSTPIRRFIGRLCYRVDFSVAELLCILLVLAVIAYAAWSVIAVARAGKEKRGRRTYTALLGAACGALTLGVVFCWFWGADYYTDSFQERSGIYERESSVEELERVTAYFAEHLAAAADEVARDEDGAFAEAEADIFAYSVRVYDNLYEEFPFLRLRDHVPKALSLSRVMSVMDFTGFYFPFTGEANLNVDCPQSFLPATIAHEMAHQRGIASEQECNFLAIAASTGSDSAAYRYSGWLMGYVHLGNALYRADQEKWRAIRDTLPDTVRLDLYQNNAYWAQFSGPVRTVSNKVYDGFLKSNGLSSGIQSYGTVVDLLLAYYYDSQS